jgi:hypothetical protein
MDKFCLLHPVSHEEYPFLWATCIEERAPWAALCAGCTRTPHHTRRQYGCAHISLALSARAVMECSAARAVSVNAHHASHSLVESLLAVEERCQTAESRSATDWKPCATTDTLQVYVDNRTLDTFLKRNAPMPPTLLEMATDFVLAQMHVQPLSPDAIRHVLQHTHRSLMGLQAQEAGTGTATPPARGNWRKSITKYTIACLDCGARLSNCRCGTSGSMPSICSRTGQNTEFHARSP